MVSAASKKIKIGDYEARFHGVSDDDQYFKYVIADNSEGEFLAICSALLPAGGAAMDVGANIGLKTFVMSSIVGETGRVIAIEGAPKVAEALKLNVKNNGWRNVAAVNAACSDQNGSAEFHDHSAWGHIVKGASGSVPMVTLDAVAEQEALERLDFIKIDIEGHELFALKGAAEIREKFNPYIYSEFNSYCLSAYGDTNPKDYLEYIYSHYNYIFRCDKNTGALVHFPFANRLRILNDNMVRSGSVDDLLFFNGEERFERLKVLNFSFKESARQEEALTQVFGVQARGEGILLSFCKQALKGALRPFYRRFHNRLAHIIRNELAEFESLKAAPAAPAPPAPGRSPDSFEKFMRAVDFIQLEQTNHCGYKCIMCTQSSMTRPKGFMSFEDLRWALTDISQNAPGFSGEIDLQGSGEALLDKDLPAKISMVRQFLPRAVISINTTLGVERLPWTVEDLVKAGLNFIKLSIRGTTAEKYAKIHGVDNFDFVWAQLPGLAALRDNNPETFSVFIRGPFSAGGKEIVGLHTKEEIETFTQKLDSLQFPYDLMSLNNFGELNFHGDSGFARAARPCSVYGGRQSRILNINWDMKVTPCCMVSNQAIVLGDLKTQTLREVFYSDAWRRFQNAHKTMRTESEYPFCYKCNNYVDEFTRRDA